MQNDEIDGPADTAAEQAKQYVALGKNYPRGSPMREICFLQAKHLLQLDETKWRELLRVSPKKHTE